MGSDMSYKDMMEEKSLEDIYNATLEDTKIINGRKCYILFLEAKSVTFINKAYLIKLLQIFFKPGRFFFDGTFNSAKG